MQGTNTAEAPRLRRPGWKDPRLLVGLLMVLTAVAGVVALVQSMDRNEGYWVAGEDLVPGSSVQAGQLSVVSVGLGDAADDYLRADQALPADATVVGTVRQGELIPAEAVVAADPQSRQPVALTLDDDLPAGTVPGTRVDIWVAAADGQQGFEEPDLVTEGAEIAEVGEVAGAFGNTGDISLQVLLGPGELPEVLNARANGDRISVVPSLGGQ